MSALNSYPRGGRRTIFAACMVFFGCGLLLLWFFGNPFERVRTIEPLAMIHVSSAFRLTHHYHAAGRDELIFLNAKEEIEVYRIDAKLTQLRVVPIVTEKEVLGDITAFPKSPRAAVFNWAGLLIVNTETGQVERKIVLASSPRVFVSPNERWLVCNEYKSDLQVIDLRTDQRFSLAPPDCASQFGGELMFVGNDALFASRVCPREYQLWDLTTRQLLWSHPESMDHFTDASVSDGARIIIGSHEYCEVRDAATGRVIRSHGADRTARALAIHPNGDYFAGYSRPDMFSFHSGLGGAVRVWNADGERLITFDAHPERWQRIEWMAVSSTGEYLVTANPGRVKVWDYHALSQR